ncbi:MAG: DUF3048 domain-containing protein [Firmicutes bacterium]|nr:DUF3048 domain-containing protein [Bacillota bacterium]
MRKSFWRIILVLTVICSILISTTACKKKAEEEPSETIIEEVLESSSETPAESSAPKEESKQESSQAPEESSEPEEEVDPFLASLIQDPNMNPLTGEIEDHVVSNKRPIAFSINNHPDAVPPVGIADADIIYEAIVEGGATRMMAIFQEVPETDTPIGSIRSLRHNYIDFAACYDAIIVHCGCSDLATNALNRRGYDTIDAISWAGGIFYRDPWRDSHMGYVHSLVTTGIAVNDFLAKDAPFPVEHDSDYTCNMLFTEEPVVIGGEVMTTVDVFFGDYRHSIFTFNAETNDYTMREFEQDYIDYATNEPIHFKNLVIIRTDVWECDGVGHQDMELTGEGEGWYCVNGVYAPIKWSRTDEDAQFVFTYTDGSPIAFGVGKTYIAVVDLGGGIE